MRIVQNLNEIDECPNCESRGLIRTTNEFGRPFKQCPVCTEEIYADEDTCYYAEKEPDAIDDTLMDIEYELGTYEMMASTPHELLMANCMRGIIEKLVSVIRRMKQ